MVLSEVKASIVESYLEHLFISVLEVYVVLELIAFMVSESQIQLLVALNQISKNIDVSINDYEEILPFEVE